MHVFIQTLPLRAHMTFGSSRNPCTLTTRHVYAPFAYPTCVFGVKYVTVRGFGDHLTTTQINDHGQINDQAMVAKFDPRGRKIVAEPPPLPPPPEPPTPLRTYLTTAIMGEFHAYLTTLTSSVPNNSLVTFPMRLLSIEYLDFE